MPTMTSHLVDRMVSLISKKNLQQLVSSIIKYPKCIPIIKHPVCIVSISHHLISSFYIILYRKDFIIWYRITIILSLQKKYPLFYIRKDFFQYMLTISQPITWSSGLMVTSMDPVSILSSVHWWSVNHENKPQKKKKGYICSLSLRYTIPDYFQKRSSNFLFICWCCCLLISPSPMQPRPKCNRWDRRSSMGTKNCWLVVWNIFIFPYIWE